MAYTPKILAKIKDKNTKIKKSIVHEQLKGLSFFSFIDSLLSSKIYG